jgi:NitT/TauT family transport system permease protein/taurine transport system permease protein
MTRLERWLGAVPFVLLVVGWWLAAHSGRFSAGAMPRPESVAAAARTLLADGTLQTDILASLGRLALGAGVSILVGVALGIAAGLHRALGDLLLPLAVFFSAVSGIAWIPLAIMWFGLGTVAVTFVIWNSIFFLVFFNTVLGIRAVPRILEQGIRTLGGGQRVLILQVFLPGALPHIVSGIRSGLGFGWRALVAAELIAATSGLGFLIFDASHYFRTDEILVGIGVIGILWAVMDAVILTPLERRTVKRWGTVTEP